MLVLLHRDYDDLSVAAARIIAAAVRRKPSLVLGLASGGTTSGMYRELARMHREEALDFSKDSRHSISTSTSASPPSTRAAFITSWRTIFFRT